MDNYDKENLREEIKRTEEKLKKLHQIPENAILIYTDQGENIVAYQLPNGERIYL